MMSVMPDQGERGILLQSIEELPCGANVGGGPSSEDGGHGSQVIYSPGGLLVRYIMK